MKHQRPPEMAPGDCIGVCAPSGAFEIDKFEAGLHVIRNMGFELKIPETIFDSKRYLAGDDRSRAESVNQLFADASVKGIICARGGFGALRTLPGIDFHLLRAHPKWFVGFSDVTALLWAMDERAFLQVIHGPVVTSLAGADEKTILSLLSALTSFPKELTAEHGVTLRPGRARGILSGGNLATLSHLLGTPFQPQFNGRILFIEDIGEAPYKIDRMLSQMTLAGVFEGLRGVVTGSFENCGDGAMILEILEEIFNPFRIPVLSGLHVGHGKTNLSLHMGCRIELDADRHTLVWIE